MTFTQKTNAMVKSRRFRTSVIGLVVILAQDLLGIAPDQVARIIEIAGVWIAGDSIDKTGSIFTSSRFWASISSVALVLLQPTLGLSCEDLVLITRFVATWIVGESLHKAGVVDSVFERLKK